MLPSEGVLKASRVPQKAESWGSLDVAKGDSGIGDDASLAGRWIPDRGTDLRVEVAERTGC